MIKKNKIINSIININYECKTLKNKILNYCNTSII